MFGYLNQPVETVLAPALAARGAPPVAYPIPEAATDVRPKRLFSLRAPSPLDDAAQQIVDLSIEDGVMHLRVPPVRRLLDLAAESLGRGGPPYSIVFDDQVGDIRTADIERASFASAPSYRMRAAVAATVGESLLDAIAVLPHAIDRTLIPDPTPWRPTSHVHLIWSDRGGVSALAAAAELDVNVTIEIDDPQMPAVVAAIAHHGMKEKANVFLASQRDRVWQALAQSCVVVIADWAAPPPLHIVHAMAFGRPVIAAMVGDAPELIDPTCGWFVRPASADDMAAALKDAVGADPRKGEAMAAECLRRVASNHDAGKIAAALYRLAGVEQEIFSDE